MGTEPEKREESREGKGVTPAAMTTLLRVSRSCRRFKATPRINRANLETLIGSARLCASGGNRQPLRYRLVFEREECAEVFPHIHWSGTQVGWRPDVSEQPTAYIVIVAPKASGPTPEADAGIAMQTLRLAAHVRGWGSCMIGSIDRAAIKWLLRLADEYEVLYVMAFGHPAERAVVEDALDGSLACYHNENGKLHVPKLDVSDLLISGAPGVI